MSMPNTLIKTRRRRPKASQQLHPVRVGIRSSGENYTKAVSRALDVLECFPDGQTSLSLMEISQLVEFHESTVFRILLTLEGRGYLHRNDDGTYMLARNLLLGRLYESSRKFARLCILS